MDMLAELTVVTRTLETRPTAEAVEAAEDMTRVAGNSFSSAEEVLAAARLLSQIHLAKGNLKGFLCTSPRACAEASLVFGWLHRGSAEVFAIPRSIRSDVMIGINTWPSRSASCGECSYAYHTRKECLADASNECARQCLRLQMEQNEINSENMLAATGD